MMASEYVKAEEAFATAASLYEKLQGYNNNMRSIPLVSLGLAYWLQGRLDEASRVLELGLREREEMFGVMDTHSFRLVPHHLVMVLLQISITFNLELMTSGIELEDFSMP